MSDMRDRVRARVKALGKSPITIAKAAGLERGFINDFLIGRKHTIRGRNLELVAEALECDVAYLTGAQATPRRAPAPVPAPAPPAGNTPRADARLFPVIGVAEAGVWRSVEAAGEQSGEIFAPIDPRFPVERHVVRARGHAVDAIGITDGAAVVCLDYDGLVDRGVRLRDGWFCVVRRLRRSMGLCETAIRRAEVTTAGVRFVDPLSGGGVEIGSHGDDEVAVAGVVERAVHLFL